MQPGSLRNDERKCLREADQDARGHLTSLSNRIHLASAQLRHDPHDVNGAAEHLDQAIAEVDKLRDALDQFRHLARQAC